MKPIEVNIKSLGKIHVMPRKVYWLGLPDSLRDKDKIELLNRDIWLVPSSLENLSSLTEEKDLILFINLDITLLKTKSIVSFDEILKAKKLITDVTSLTPLHTVAHTTHINSTLSDIFNKSSITYIEKNLYDTSLAMQTIIKAVDFIYSKTQRVKREYLRIEIDAESQMTIKCSIGSERNTKVLLGRIRDVSLNGLQIVFDSTEYEKTFSLKDFIELNFALGPYNIKVQKALVTRMDKNTQSIGVHFDIHNEKMIRDLFAAQYTEVLYQWIRDLQKKELESGSK